MTATMSDRDALYAAVLRDPQDDTVRLVLADWLDEHGEGERAEFIRVQCELARRTPDWKDHGIPAIGFNACGCHSCLGYDDLRRRERELWDGLGGGPYDRARVFGLPSNWLASIDLSPPSGYTPSDGLGLVSRGFVGEVRLTTATFLGGPCGYLSRRELCQDGVLWRGPSDHRELVGPHAACSGTGRVPGFAWPIAAAHPVTDWRLTDREPNDYGPPEDGCRFGWLPEDSRIDPGPAVLPPLLHAMLPRRDCVRGPLRWATAAAAHAALSRACVAYARRLAGLPPL